MSFAEVLDAADRLTAEEQEEIIDILRRRMVERRRRILAKEIQEAQREFEQGGLEPVTPDDMVKEILS